MRFQRLPPPPIPVFSYIILNSLYFSIFLRKLSILRVLRRKNLPSDLKMCQFFLQNIGKLLLPCPFCIVLGKRTTILKMRFFKNWKSLQQFWSVIVGGLFQRELRAIETRAAELVEPSAARTGRHGRLCQTDVVHGWTHQRIDDEASQRDQGC